MGEGLVIRTSYAILARTRGCSSIEVGIRMVEQLGLGRVSASPVDVSVPLGALILDV